jgi:hypothetical protein
LILDIHLILYLMGRRSSGLTLSGQRRPPLQRDGLLGGLEVEWLRDGCRQNSSLALHSYFCSLPAAINPACQVVLCHHPA